MRCTSSRPNPAVDAPRSRPRRVRDRPRFASRGEKTRPRPPRRARVVGRMLGPSPAVSIARPSRASAVRARLNPAVLDVLRVQLHRRAVQLRVRLAILRRAPLAHRLPQRLHVRDLSLRARREKRDEDEEREEDEEEETRGGVRHRS
eukprot:30456-Pelagococcus_subviridis.AAC.3